MCTRVSRWLAVGLSLYLSSTSILQHVHALPATTLICNATYPNTPNTAYPNQAQICTTFSHLAGTNANYSLFFGTVVDNVNWTIEGTHPLAGQYNNKTLLEAAFQRIDSVGSTADPLSISLVNIIGGGAEQWSVQELGVRGTCKNGLVFDNRYAWVTRWNAEGMIVEARAYLDSTLVAWALTLNEVGLFTYSDQRKSTTPFVTLPVQELVEASGLQNSTG